MALKKDEEKQDTDSECLAGPNAPAPKLLSTQSSVAPSLQSGGPAPECGAGFRPVPQSPQLVLVHSLSTALVACALVAIGQQEPLSWTPVSWEEILLHTLLPDPRPVGTSLMGIVIFKRTLTQKSC